MLITALPITSVAKIMACLFVCRITINNFLHGLEYMLVWLHMELKPKTVHYLKFYVELMPDVGTPERYTANSFEYYLERAIANLPNDAKPEQRLTTTGKTVSLSLIDGKLASIHGCKSGVLYIKEEGKQVAAEEETKHGKHIVGAQPAIVREETSTKTTEPTHATVPQKAASIRLAPLADGVTYFAVCRDYIAYFSDSGNASNVMKSFFEYLLKSLAKVIPENAVIHEEKRIVVDPLIAVQHGGIKDIHYMFGHISEEDSMASLLQSAIKTKIKGDAISKCKHEAILQKCKIQLLVSPGRGSRGLKDETLKTLVYSMSDIELENTIITFKDGDVLTGREIRPNGHIQVETKRGIPVQRSAQIAISKWLADLIENRIAG